MINPLNEIHRDRTRDAIKHWRQRLDPICADRKEWLKKYRGRSYADGAVASKRQRRLANLLYQAGSTYQQLLAANRPRYTVGVGSPQGASFAKLTELHLNNLAEEIKLEDTLEKNVLDAFFLMGISRVFMADSVPVILEENVISDPGRPCVAPVSLDNWFHDLSADHWGRVRIMGEFYNVSRERMLDSDLFDRDVAASLPAFTGEATNDGRERSSEISGGQWDRIGQIEDEVRLVDVFYARERLIVTWSAAMNTKPLHVQKWNGDDYGPYPILTFDDVPDNTLPVSQAENLEPSDDLTNSLLAKLGRQARKARSVVTYAAEAAKDAEAVRNAEDLAWVKVKDPRLIQAMKIGNVDPQVNAMSIQSGDIFDRQAGNLKAAAGLGPQSDTAAQDAMIHSAVSGKIAKMQTRVMRYAGVIGKELARLLYEDQVNYREGYLEVPGMPDVKVPAHWTPGERPIPFADLHFEVVPESMPFRSSKQKLDTLQGALTNIILPAMKTPGINTEKLLRLVADRIHDPDILDLFDLVDPTAEQQGGEPRQSPVTRRENIRRNIPTAGTASNRNQVMLQALWGAGANSDQLQTLGAG